MSNLTTLANVKAWLGLTDTNVARDAVLTRAIKVQSRFIESWLSRVFQSQTYVEYRDGGGAGDSLYAMTFANDPVSSVISVSVGGSDVPASTDGGVKAVGYGFDSDTLWLSPATGTPFVKGRSNVRLEYVGGFLVLPFGQASSNRWLLPADQQVIPATPFQITPSNLWTSDNGVKFVSNGVALTKIPSGTPTTGQYTVDAAGVYTFATADTGKTVALSYGYVPADIEQACIDILSLSFRGKDRIGLISQAVGTENVSFFVQKDMPDWASSTLQQYKRVFVL